MEVVEAVIESSSDEDQSERVDAISEMALTALIMELLKEIAKS